MASSYSTRLRLELMADGEKSSTWGQVANNNVFALIDEAISGYIAIDVAGASDHTLTTVNGGTDEARQAVIKLTGLLTGNIALIVPSVEWKGVVWNATTGAFTVTVKTSGGTGIVVDQTGVAPLFCDGTNVERAVNLAGLGIDMITGDISITGAVDITGSLQVVSTATDANEAPTLDLWRNSASPDDADVLGGVLFSGEDDGGNATAYARIRGAIVDQTHPEEDGAIFFRTMLAGTEGNRMAIANGAYMAGATGGDQGANTFNASAFYIDGQDVKERVVDDETGTTYTFASGDPDKYFRFTNSSAITVTVPPNATWAAPVGTQIDGIQAGAGQVTFSEGSGVTINSKNDYLKLLGQWSGFSLVKVDTNEWDLHGDLSA